MPNEDRNALHIDEPWRPSEMPPATLPPAAPEANTSIAGEEDPGAALDMNSEVAIDAPDKAAAPLRRAATSSRA